MTRTENSMPTTVTTNFLVATAALAGTAIANRQMAKAAETKHPPEGRFMMVDGARRTRPDACSGRPGGSARRRVRSFFARDPVPLKEAPAKKVQGFSDYLQDEPRPE
jgi:hypothetical protein